MQVKAMELNGNMMRALSLVTAGLLSAATPCSAIAMTRDDGGALEAATRAIDYAWFEGYFSHNTMKAKSWNHIVTLANTRALFQTDQVNKELNRIGVSAPKLQTQCWGDSACLKVFVTQEEASSFSSWSGFQVALKEAYPYFLGYKRAVSLVELIARDQADDLAYALSSRKALDQLFRELYDVDKPLPEAPPSRTGRAALAMLAASEENRLAISNGNFLKGVLASHGWPKRSSIGVSGSRDALLIVQHSPDIVFQVQTLKLLESISPDNEVDGDALAYLYDRVTFNLTAHQKYGTQYTCLGGQHIALGLEEPAKVDDYRASLGLSSLRSYLINAPGSCP